MELKIRITSHDLGFGAREIKSLLDKFSAVDFASFSSGDKVIVHLDFNKEEADELSLAIIWKFLRKYQTLSCNKEIIYRDGTQRYFNDRHFFDSLIGTQATMFSTPDILISFETFLPIRPTKTNTQNSQMNTIFNNLKKTLAGYKGGKLADEIMVHITE